MDGKRRTTAEISHVLAQAEAGVPIKELCRKYGVSEATFYVWRRRGARCRGSAVLCRRNRGTRGPLPLDAAYPYHAGHASLSLHRSQKPPQELPQGLTPLPMRIGN